MPDWYRYESHGPSTLVIFDIEGVQARAGVKGTRYFQDRIEGRPDSKEVIKRAHGLMPLVRARWPWPDWPKPLGLRADEEELILPSMMLAMGEPEEAVAAVVATASKRRG